MGFTAKAITTYALISLITAAPIDFDDKKRNNYIRALKEIEKPIKDLQLKTQQVRENYAEHKKKDYPDTVNFEEEWTSDDRKYEDECEAGFSNSVHDQWFINGMRKFQDLVKVTQDLQLSETAIDNGDVTHFVDEFRRLEYDMRNLVEDTMRSNAFSIVHEKSFGDIPPYSVGGVSSTTHQSPIKTIKRSIIKLGRMRKCLELFVNRVVTKGIGKN